MKPFGSRLLATIALAGLSGATLFGCGDALLPSDFSGPPVGQVGANVQDPDHRAYVDAARPRMHIEWLTSFGDDASTQQEPGSLTGQQVTFQRSQKLSNDWDIGLAAPVEAVKLALDVDMQPVTFAVGKMVYFDDRDADGTLDWSCRDGNCDQILAISSEYIVYIDRPLACPQLTSSKTTEDLGRWRMDTGYHYFVLDGDRPIEIEADGSLNFLAADSQSVPADSDPTESLHTFTSQLLYSMRLGALQGCE